MGIFSAKIWDAILYSVFGKFKSLDDSFWTHKICRRHPPLLRVEPSILGEIMKILLEQFDFSKLTETSVLVFEIPQNNRQAVESAQRTIQALFSSGKIPKSVLVLVQMSSSEFKIRELDEKAMNQNGWFKMKPLKIEIENAPAQSVPTLPPASPSV